MFEQIFTTQNIIQGGSVILALYLVYSSIRKDAAITKIITNHLDHDLKQRGEEVKSRTLLSETLQELKDVIHMGLIADNELHALVKKSLKK